MASARLVTPQNKPAYYKLTANIMVDGKVVRRYSRFDFDPKSLRTTKTRNAAAMAAAMEFERQEQELTNQEKSDSNKSFTEVAKEYILDSKARLAPSARLRGSSTAAKTKPIQPATKKIISTVSSLCVLGLQINPCLKYPKQITNDFWKKLITTVSGCMRRLFFSLKQNNSKRNLSTSWR